MRRRGLVSPDRADTVVLKFGGAGGPPYLRHLHCQYEFRSWLRADKRRNKRPSSETFDFQKPRLSIQEITSPAGDLLCCLSLKAQVKLVCTFTHDLDH
jgi:hypothetical protein